MVQFRTIQNRSERREGRMPQKVQKHISVKYYQNVIMKEFASKTGRDQTVCYQLALDEFIYNNRQEIQKQGINSNFLTKKLKKTQLDEVPSELKEAYGLK